MKRKALYSVIAVALCAMQAAWAEPPRYMIVDLGVTATQDPEIDEEIGASSINNRNTIVGTLREGIFCCESISSRAFSYTNGPMKDLGTIDGHQFLRARDINDKSEIIGEYYTDSSRKQPFIYKNGNFIDLAPFTNSNYAIAAAINNLGEALISKEDDFIRSPEGRFKGLVIDRNFNVTKIPLRPVDINDKGEVIGTRQVLTRTGEWRTKSYRYNIRTKKIQSIEINNRAEAINNKGHIVGQRKFKYIMDEYFSMAYLHDGTKFIDLGVVAPWKAPYPEAINELDQVVGWVQTDILFDDGEERHAFYYDKQNGSLDLNNLVMNARESGWGFLWSASDINDKGHIVGQGYLRSGALKAFKLVPLGKPQVVNQLVTFKSISGSNQTSDFPNWGCSADTVRFVRYKARLTNTSGRVLMGLELKVKGLTNVKELQSAKGALKVGDTFAVGTFDGYSNGKLGKNESVEVPIIACLANRDRFKPSFDVLAAKEENSYARNQ